MTTRATITVTTLAGWVGTYHGGPYIEIAHETALDEIVDVVNVWDYALDVPTIMFTAKAVTRKVEEWVHEYGPEYAIAAIAHRG